MASELKIGRFRVNLPIDPPFKTARALSDLYTFQYSQWVPIWNSQKQQVSSKLADLG